MAVSEASAPFRADHVGSLLRPPPLKEAHARALAGELARTALHALEDRCIADAVKLQEGVGLHAVTDGELRRTHFHSDFLERLVDDDGRPSVHFKFRSDDPAAEAEPRREFLPPSVRISGKVRRGAPIETDGFRYLASLTGRTPKLTIPSPTMLLRGGAAAVDREAYPDIEAFYADIGAAYRAEIADLAAAGCRYIQLDDTNFGYLCDPRMVEAMRQRGDDADRLPARFARVINDALAGRPADMVVCIHVCRGNGRGRWAAQGGYEPIADILFNVVAVDGYFLEYDTERAGGFEPLRHLPKGKRAVLGLVSSKVPELDADDAIRRRIDEAAAFAPLESLCLSPQCGFSSGYRGNPVSADDQRRKLEQVVRVAEAVWGTAQ